MNNWILKRWWIEYYPPLYRFALSLCKNSSQAGDLTQQTFYLWAKKGHQLNDLSKVKTWLFTVLYREFLKIKRQSKKFQHQEFNEALEGLTDETPLIIDETDGEIALRSLHRVEELYRAPLTLFYLGNHSYREMADILNVPMGTVVSRLARGKEQLRRVFHSMKRHR